MQRCGGRLQGRRGGMQEASKHRKYTCVRTRPGKALPPAPLVRKADKGVAENVDTRIEALLVGLLLDAAADGQVDESAGRCKGACAACAGTRAARPPLHLLHLDRRGQTDRADEVECSDRSFVGVGVGCGGGGGRGGRARRRAGAASTVDRMTLLQMTGSVRGCNVESDNSARWQRSTAAASSQPQRCQTLHGG